jgi:hypothetical protein
MCISKIGQRRALQASAATRLPNHASMVSSLAMKDTVVSEKTDTTHIIVQHDYHDHATDVVSDYHEEHPARGGVTSPFPLKLHEMLEIAALEGNEHIVSWQPHGRCFVVHKPKEFVELLPGYFKLSKLASFQRQLNLYGFQRLTHGRDRGGYYHELFLKDKVYLAHSIQRVKVKGTGVRARSNPDQEPDLWNMNWVAGKDAGNEDASSPSQESEDASSTTTPPVSSPCIPSHMLKFLQDEQDLVLSFADKTFHFLDPFVDKWSVQGVDQLLAVEADFFFQDFRFPDDISATELENDHVFGDLLEQMIA